jgi:glycosyltransferase involved in cell wall biosynthesis
MRILQVIPFLWSGAGNVVTRLCEAQAAGNDVGIVTSGTSKGFTDWPEYRKRLKSAGVEHFQIDFFDRNPAVFWPSTDAFVKLASRWKPDVIHCHSGVPACAAAVSGLRFIGQIHSWGVVRPEWMNVMDLHGFRSASQVLCGSLAYRKILIDGDINPARICYVPWGLDLKEIRHKSNEFPSSARRGMNSLFRIGFLGRLEPRKAQLELVQAFNGFHRRFPLSRLELIGPVADKKYRDDICAFVSKSGLSDRVKLRGRVSNPYSRVANWNLFTSLSCDEGQGLAILEAMALGIPVLCRNVAGVEDYLRDGKTGLAVSSAAPDEVAERMAWALGHRGELARIALQAQKMVEADYNWDSTLEEMNSLYENFITPSRGTRSRLA